MNQARIFFLIIFSTCLLIACSGNTTAGSGKDTTSNISATPGSGDDLYYELATKSTGKNFSMSSVTKISVSSKGEVRKEMNMTNSFSGKVHSSEIVVIANSDTPDESIIINDAEKTYTKNHIDRNGNSTGEKIQSTITKVGDEKILGFNCVHVRIISTETLGTLSSHTDTLDIWKSNEVPMLSKFKQMMDKFEPKTEALIFSTKVADQLKQMGCEGFVVKIEVKGKDASTTTVLTKVEQRTIPAGMFQIPSGYKEDKS